MLILLRRWRYKCYHVMCGVSFRKFKASSGSKVELKGREIEFVGFRYTYCDRNGGCLGRICIWRIVKLEMGACVLLEK